MIAGSTSRKTCILLGCLALSLFAAQLLLGESLGLPSLYRFREPPGWETEAEDLTPVPLSDESSRLLETSQPPEPSEIAALPQVAIVAASQSSDNTQWLKDGFPDWDKHIYVTNDHNAELTVPMNKGREGMVYLTYVLIRPTIRTQLTSSDILSTITIDSQK